MLVQPVTRLACVADSDAIAHMSRSAIEQGLGWHWRPDRVRSAIRDRATNVAVSEDAGVVIGFGIMLYHQDSAHLSLLAVAERCRGHGIGAGLVTWLEKPARVAGAECIRVEARADNVRAVTFYERLGFKRTQTVPGYYSGLVDAVKLEKALWPEPSGSMVRPLF